MLNPSNLQVLSEVLAITVLVLVTVKYVGPMFSKHKCPNCSVDFLSPIIAEATERTVYPGGYDDHGLSLPPIVERTHTCPRCEYRKVSYLIPEGYMPAGRSVSSWQGVRVRDANAINLDGKGLREADAGKMVLHSYAEWRQLYDSLKSKQGEQGRRYPIGL